MQLVQHWWIWLQVKSSGMTRRSAWHNMYLGLGQSPTFIYCTPSIFYYNRNMRGRGEQFPPDLIYVFYGSRIIVLMKQNFARRARATNCRHASRPTRDKLPKHARACSAGKSLARQQFTREKVSIFRHKNVNVTRRVYAHQLPDNSAQNTQARALCSNKM